MNFSNIRGFNYQPSYGSTGLEIWSNFDAQIVKVELGRGKQYFPNFSATRLWLSWDAFNRNPQKFSDDFESALSIAASYDILVMPVLFNRWHDSVLDYGGIYLDHFLPKTSWIQSQGMLFDAYMQSVVGGHANDQRILAWDLCNEPFAYSCEPETIPEIVNAELAWLTELYNQCKQLNAQAPVTVGIHQCHHLNGIKQIEPISDILSIHPYWAPHFPGDSRKNYEAQLDEYVSFSQQVGKPLLATEACWGDEDDYKRAEIISYSLEQLKKRGIGWMAYLLHHSLVADAHRREFGHMGSPGNLSFIEADGRLRPSHEVFNNF